MAITEISSEPMGSPVVVRNKEEKLVDKENCESKEMGRKGKRVRKWAGGRWVVSLCEKEMQKHHFTNNLDALPSVRRPKLLFFSLWVYCSLWETSGTTVGGGCTLFSLMQILLFVRCWASWMSTMAVYDDYPHCLIVSLLACALQPAQWVKNKEESQT